MPLRRIAFATVYLLSLAAAAFAWPHAPATGGVPVGTPNTTPSTAPQILADGSGGAFVAFVRSNALTFNLDIYVQHFDAAGNPLWTSGGVQICDASYNRSPVAVVRDGSGGVIAVWYDLRSYSSYDLYAQRISSAGVPQWTTNGVVVANGAGTQAYAHVVEDGSGGAWAVWDDDRNFATTGSDIYAQHIMSTGTMVYGTSALAVCTAASSQSNADVTVDESGNAVIVWNDLRSASTVDIYAQKYAGGVMAWTANGIAVCTAAGDQYAPMARALAGGQIIVAWSDGRGGDRDIYAQRIDDATGSMIWTANGVAVCTASSYQSMSAVVVDASGMAVIAWLDQRNASGQGLYAQKVDVSGAMQWTGNGVPVHASSIVGNTARVVSDGLGGTLFMWQDQRVDNGDIYAQRLSSSGSPLWTTTGVPVCTAGAVQSPYSLCAGATGGALMAWEDNRPIGNGARVQAVDEWGYLGAEPVMAGVKDVPNDQGGQVKLSWYASPLDTDPLFRNISAYLIFRSVPTSTAAQLARAAFDAQGGATLRGTRYVRTRYAAQDYFWEQVAYVSPYHLGAYSAVVATAGDSVTGSNPRSVFMVMAQAGYGASWWTSAPDSGYSVDNLAPAAPAPFTGQYAGGSTSLHWNPNAEADIAGYRVYRGETPGFAIGTATLVGQSADTGYVDAAAGPHYYKLTAIDTHGNESPAASLLPAGTADVEDAVLHAAFALPAPNPVRGGQGTALRFSLATAGCARLAVYDAQGRLVRELASGARAAGTHGITFDARDASGRPLAPGLYLARLSAPGLDATRRLVVIE